MDMKKAGLNTLLSEICFELCRESIINSLHLFRGYLKLLDLYRDP